MIDQFLTKKPKKKNKLNRGKDNESLAHAVARQPMTSASKKMKIVLMFIILSFVNLRRW